MLQIIWRPALVVFLAAVFGAKPANPAIAPKTVTITNPKASLADVVSEMHRQTGLVVHPSATIPGTTPCPESFDHVPFWKAVEQIAKKTDTRIALNRQGREISLEKREGLPAPSSVDGAFRVVVRQVQARTSFDTGKSITEVSLDIHWEPRFPVFRIDSEPAIDVVTDDQASQLTPIVAKARTRPSGFVYSTKVRVEGVPRVAKTITRLAGTFHVTAAERMLPFSFDLAGAIPTTPQNQLGVKATLTRFGKLDGRWEAELNVMYPPGQPEFESFESWLTDNRARLIGPDNTKPVAPSDSDIPEQGQRVVAIYRFPENSLTNPKGWKLTYETPAPLIEFPVRFDLRDIPLP